MAETEQPYSNRELNHWFTDLFKRMDKQDSQLEALNTKVGIQNGRVTKQEAWSGEAKVIIEKLASDLSKTSKDYNTNKTRIFTVISVLTLIGGGIIALAVYSIQAKIDRGIQTAFDTRFSSIKIEK